jgi:hypothetical protein
LLVRSGQVKGRAGQVRFTRSPLHTGSPQTLGARDSEPTTGVDRGGLRGSPGKIRRPNQQVAERSCGAGVKCEPQAPLT